MNNGVVHVGAHRGEEVPGYIFEGRRPIICFEPQELGWRAPAEVRLVPCALGDYDGIATLRIPHHLHDTPERDTQSASCFPLIDRVAKEIGWTPTECDVIQITVRRFDSWAEEERFDAASCSLLVIDAHGMELKVLQGFGRYLVNFSDVVVECSKISPYESGASAAEVIAFLKSNGFVQMTPTLKHGDITFAKGDDDASRNNFPNQNDLQSIGNFYR